MEKLSIISPTRGEKYTIDEVLQKGLDRSGLILEELEVIDWKITWNRDVDLALRLVFHVTPSCWGDSVNFKFDGVIPLHVTPKGKISIGYKAEGSPCTHPAEPNKPVGDEIRGKGITQQSGILYCWIDGEKDKGVDVKIEDVIDNPLFHEVLKRLFAERFIGNLFSIKRNKYFKQYEIEVL